MSPVRARALGRTESRGASRSTRLWPRTTIATAAVGNLLGGDAMMRASPQARDHGRRRLCDFHKKPSREFTGQFCIDDKLLYASGVRATFEPYRVDPTGAADVGFLLCPMTMCRRPASA